MQIKIFIGILLSWIVALNPVFIWRLSVTIWGACKDGYVTLEEFNQVAKLTGIFPIRIPFIKPTAVAPKTKTPEFEAELAKHVIMPGVVKKILTER